MGQWTSGLWQPPALAPWVERLWYSEGKMGAARERILPNGLLELAVCLGDAHRLVEGSGVETLRLCLTGMQSSAVVIEHPLLHRVLGLRLHPAGAYALLSQPMSEVSGVVVDLHDVLGVAIDELAERCHATTSIESCFRVAAGWLRERIERARTFDARVAWSVARIESTGGQVTISELRETTGLSKTRLVEIFREQVGVAPKVYARIVRFRRALALLDGEPASLVTTALEAGYYDQSHMTTEFRTLGGLTPREFVAVRYPGSTTATA